MTHMPLWPGQKVRVYEPEWDDETETYFLPDGWAQPMLDFVGQVVTISNVDAANDAVFIEEDGGEWEWYLDDFEVIDELPGSDPNIKFKELKSRECRPQATAYCIPEGLKETLKTIGKEAERSLWSTEDNDDMPF